MKGCLILFKALIIDDDKEVRSDLKKYPKWAEFGFEIIAEAANGEEALEKIATSKFDLVFTDIRMPKIDGIELLKEIKKAKQDLCVIFISSYCDFDFAKQGIILGAFDYIVKPIDEDSLDDVLKRAQQTLTEKWEKDQQNKRVVEKLEESLSYYYPIEHEQKIALFLMEDNVQVQ